MRVSDKKIKTELLKRGLNTESHSILEVKDELAGDYDGENYKHPGDAINDAIDELVGMNRI